MSDPYAKPFSLAVLDGLFARRPGAAAELTAGRFAITGERVATVARGEDEFTDDEIGVIEDLADLTGLQLAAAVAEPAGGPMTDMADGWARVRHAERVPDQSAVVA